MNDKTHTWCGGFPELSSAGDDNKVVITEAVKELPSGRRHKKRTIKSQDWVKVFGCSVQTIARWWL